jgi:hypothetical protein
VAQVVLAALGARLHDLAVAEDELDPVERRHPTSQLLHQQSLMDRPETVFDVPFDRPLV